MNPVNEGDRNEKIDSATRTRMLTVSLAGMTWVTATAALMYITGLFNTTTALAVGPGGSLLLFGGYLVTSRVVEVPDVYKGYLPADDPVLIFAVTMVVTTVVWAVWK